MVNKKPNDSIIKLQNDLKNKTRYSECIYYDHSNCTNRIIDSHSIARNKILTRLSDNSMVFIPEFDINGTMTTDKNEINSFIDIMKSRFALPAFQIKEISIKKASISKVFCGYHDMSLFQTIDTQNFEETTEQIFQYSYRAFSKEYSSVQREHRLYEQMNLKSTVDISQNQVKLNNIERIKAKFDQACNTGNKDLFGNYFFTLPYEINLAVSTVFTLSQDLEGNIIIDVSNRNLSYIPTLMLNIFPEESKTIILFTYLKEDENYFNQYFKQLKKLYKRKFKKFKQAINFILVNFPENIIFGKKINSYMTENKLWKEYLDDFVEFTFIPMINIDNLGDMSNMQYNDYQNRELKYDFLQKFK